MKRISAKKSLGQHFLRSKTAIKQIVDAAHLSPDDTVLEIGPGEGALTDALLESGARVVAVETDARCIEKLEERFALAIDKKRLLLIEGDIRNDAVQKMLFNKKYCGTLPYKLVANIPYYITGMLFRLFLETLRQPTRIVFLVQKEVAQLIVAKDHKEGILSLAVKAYGTPRYVATVKREAFTPPPKVDSAIIAIEDISRARLEGLPDEDYFRVIKAGFGAKRKMLLGNLSKEFGTPRETLETIFRDIGIDAHARGEDLAAPKWLLLAKSISIQQGSNKKNKKERN
jgi:16S rRNA (adenine1518-N6/adenine1519-N6)-dimethyltransferase